MHRGSAVKAAVALSVVLIGSSCDKLRSDRPAPFEAFAPGEFHPPVKAPVVPAPEGLKKPWRVQMLQTDPRPFKNTHWRKIPITASGLVEMPPGSSFRCLYNPVKIQGTSDESMKDVASWQVVREVWCSNDGWRTHSATGLRVHYEATGAPLRGIKDQAELVLFEVIDGRATTISILLRAD